MENLTDNELQELYLTTKVAFMNAQSDVANTPINKMAILNRTLNEINDKMRDIEAEAERRGLRLS